MVCDPLEGLHYSSAKSTFSQSLLPSYETNESKILNWPINPDLPICLVSEILKDSATKKMGENYSLIFFNFRDFWAFEIDKKHEK